MQEILSQRDTKQQRVSTNGALVGTDIYALRLYAVISDIVDDQ